MVSLGEPTYFAIVMPHADMELSAENAPRPVPASLLATLGEIIESGRIKVVPELALRAVG